TDTSDGLVNGAIGILRKISYGTTSCGKKVPLKVWMEFPKNVGVKLKKKEKLHMDFVPLNKESRVIHSWPGKKLEVVRIQFALVPAEAITIHKSQGSTFTSVVISITYYTKNGIKRWINRRAMYVGFSRCTTLSGLYIDGEFVPPKPLTKEDPVYIALRKLQSRPVFKEDYVQFKEICKD